MQSDEEMNVAQDRMLRWRLEPDGTPWRTHASLLVPVRRDGEPAILKVPASEEERQGGAVLAWWNGDGAAPVLAHDDMASLITRAEGMRILSDMARFGDDDEACRILCSVAARLHVARPSLPPSGLMTMERMFEALEPAAATHGGILNECLAAACGLLAEEHEVIPLHGDLHHGNVLDFGAAGWLAIDPKALAGPRAFDYANIFTNPDLDHPEPPVATVRATFERRLAIVTATADIEPRVMLRWILAWAGLSAAWYFEDDDPADVDLAVAELARSTLD